MKPLWEQLLDGEITTEEYYEKMNEKINDILLN